MKTQMTYQEFNARWIFIIRKIGYSLSSKFISEFYRSTLPLIDKLLILETMPFTEVEVNQVLEILQSHSDMKLFDRRDVEWTLFLSDLSIEVSLNEQKFGVIAA